MTKEEFILKLPKKRMSAGGIILNSIEKILFVKPSYQKHWLVPGGVIEKNESPMDAANREVFEEIGLHLKAKNLLCVDYKHDKLENDEALSFIFDFGVIDDVEIGNIQIDMKEIIEYRFASINEMEADLPSSLYTRIKMGLMAKTKSITFYLENGKHIFE